MSPLPQRYPRYRVTAELRVGVIEALHRLDVALRGRLPGDYAEAGLQAILDGRAAVSPRTVRFLRESHTREQLIAIDKLGRRLSARFDTADSTLDPAATAELLSALSIGRLEYVPPAIGFTKTDLVRLQNAIDGNLSLIGRFTASGLFFTFGRSRGSYAHINDRIFALIQAEIERQGYSFAANNREVPLDLFRGKRPVRNVYSFVPGRSRILVYKGLPYTTLGELADAGEAELTRRLQKVFGDYTNRAIAETRRFLAGFNLELAP